jgi:hypothetical protein
MQTQTMKHRQMTVLVLGTVVLAAALTQKSLAQTEAGAPTTKASVIEFQRQTLVFAPTRDDMTVSQVVFSVFASHPGMVRVNGAKSNSTFMYIDLKRVAKNQFELPPLKIEFSTNEPGGLLCVSIKVWFSEVSNQYDSMFYQNLDDRYALVAWCTGPTESSEARSRFKQNRVATVKEFKETLSKPFVIKLKPTSLRREWAPQQ